MNVVVNVRYDSREYSVEVVVSNGDEILLQGRGIYDPENSRVDDRSPLRYLHVGEAGVWDALMSHECDKGKFFSDYRVDVKDLHEGLAKEVQDALTKGREKYEQAYERKHGIPAYCRPK